MLSTGELERYDRQIMIEEFGEEGQEDPDYKHCSHLIKK